MSEKVGMEAVRVATPRKFGGVALSVSRFLERFWAGAKRPAPLNGVALGVLLGHAVGSLEMAVVASVTPAFALPVPVWSAAAVAVIAGVFGGIMILRRNKEGAAPRLLNIWLCWFALFTIAMSLGTLLLVSVAIGLVGPEAFAEKVAEAMNR